MVMGKANLDPFDGEGRHGAIRELLADRRLQDPAPRSAYGLRAITDLAQINWFFLSESALFPFKKLNQRISILKP